MRSVRLLLLIVLGIAIPAFFGWQIQRAGTSGFWLLVLLPTVVLAVVGAVRAQRVGELGEWVKPRWGDATAGVLSAALMLGGAYLFTRVVAPPDSPRVAWLLRIYMQVGEPSVLQKNTALLAGGIIVAAIAEEILWRGFVTTLVAERFGSRYAWMIAAVLYGAAHVPAAFVLGAPNAGPNVILPMGAMGAGFVWGALVRMKSGSLVAAMISHALFDWCVISMFRLHGLSL